MTLGTLRSKNMTLDTPHAPSAFRHKYLSSVVQIGAGLLNQALKQPLPDHISSTTLQSSSRAPFSAES